MIRLMEANDLQTVKELEQLCFSDAWSEGLIRESLGGELDTWFVVDVDGNVCGYGSLRIVAGEGEVERIAVHPGSRGWGYGKKLMERMVSFAREQGVQEMTLEVRAGNREAINLYASCGFVQEAVRKAYYREPLEDGIIMWNHRI